MKHVLIIGSGLIGLSTAFALKQRGVPDITILDSAPGPHGASVVNAGWITSMHSEPVGAPGMTMQAMKWMLRSDSPLYIKPAVNDPEFIRWLFRFWRSLNEKSYSHAIEVMTALNEKTFDLFDSYVEAGVRFEMWKEGLLMAFLNRANLERIRTHLDRYTALGLAAPRTYLGQDARDLEPGLSTNVDGVLHIEKDRHLRPDTLTAGLTQWLDERGVNFVYDTTVTGFEISGGSVTAVRSTTGQHEADAVVIAAGAHSGRIAKLAGKALPVQAGKGYSIDFANPPTALTHPLSLYEPKMAVTPMCAWTRLAGTMELSGINTIVRQERVRALARGASQFLRDWPNEVEEGKVGSGMRPMTPDGMPIIGTIPGVRNLTVSTGHQMLGLGLAPATAHELAELILTGETPAVLEPFSASRFR
jgi:D-amino-acid dehydrogenase